MDELSTAEYTRIVRTVALHCGDIGWAEDAVQEAILRGLERPDRKIDNLSAWLVTVATNQVRRRARRGSLERRSLALLAPLGSDTVSPPESLDDLHAAFVALPYRQKQIVGLYYFHDLGVQAIADALGISPGNVKKSLHRARARLEATLRPAPNPEGECHHV